MSKKLNLTPFQWALSVISCGALFSLLGTVALSFADNNPATSNIATSSTLVVPYEGYLMLDSTPLNGTQQMKFSLYEAASGGTVQWIEAQDVAINAGRFSVALGTGTKDASITQTFSQVVLDAQQLYLAISVYDANAAAWIDLSGRQAIEAVPYAAWSANSADFKVEGALTVAGTSKLNGSLEVKADAMATNALTVTGRTKLDGTELEFTGSSFQMGTNTALGNGGRAMAQLTGDQLVINDQGSFAGGTLIDSAATVDGKLTVNDVLTAEKNVVVKGNLVISDVGSLITAQDITVIDDLNVLGDVTYTGKLTGLGRTASITAGTGNFNSPNQSRDLGVDEGDGFCFLTGVRFASASGGSTPFCEVTITGGKWVINMNTGTFGAICKATCITY